MGSVITTIAKFSSHFIKVEFKLIYWMTHFRKENGIKSSPCLLNSRVIFRNLVWSVLSLTYKSYKKAWLNRHQWGYENLLLLAILSSVNFTAHLLCIYLPYIKALFMIIIIIISVNIQEKVYTIQSPSIRL